MTTTKNGEKETVKVSIKKDENITTIELPKGTLFPGDLRDWFAGMALQGMNANPELLQAVTQIQANVSDGSAFSRMARKAYEQADAMLSEREKP